MQPARRRYIAWGLGLTLCSVSLANDRPAMSDPKVVATIQPLTTPAGSCLVSIDVRDPKSDTLFAVPRMTLKAGAKGQAHGKAPDLKVEVSVETAAGCVGGTYRAKVWANGDLAYSKKGQLTAKAP